MCFVRIRTGALSILAAVSHTLTMLKIKLLSQTLVALVALIALVVIVLAALKVGALAVVLPAAAGGLAPAILAIATLVSSIGETPSQKGN